MKSVQCTVKAIVVEMEKEKTGELGKSDLANEKLKSMTCLLVRVHEADSAHPSISSVFCIIPQHHAQRFHNSNICYTFVLKLPEFLCEEFLDGQTSYCRQSF